MLRTVKAENTKVLAFKDYATIMALLEEDFVGSKPIHLHPLFYRYDRGAMKPQGPYDYDSVEKRIYVDPQEQYNHGLGMSCIPLKTKNVQSMRGMGPEQTRGREDKETQLHIHTFEALGNKTGDLLKNLFTATAKK